MPPVSGYPRPLFSPPSGFPNSADANVPSIAAASVASNVDENVASSVDAEIASGADTEVASRFAISNFYVTVTVDGTIQLFSLPDKRFNAKENLLMTFKGASVTDIVFSPDSRFLSWGRGDGSISLYNIQENDLVIVVPPTETSQVSPKPEIPNC